MHPYHHALSSQRSYGGVIINYLPIHNWFDATKAALAHFTHRALHHHLKALPKPSSFLDRALIMPIMPSFQSRRSVCNTSPKI